MAQFQSLVALVATGLTSIATAQRNVPEHPVFMPSTRCALCHSIAPRATALRTELGEDGSPYGLWQATMMANSFRDPYWRAQVAREVHAHPEDAAEIQELCITCHAPMAHHGARLEGGTVNDVRSLVGNLFAEDGVSCTVCHQARPTDFGEPASFNGRLDIQPGKRIFGPYPNPNPGPMQVHVGYTPEYGPHVQESALCGSCHTLHTTPHGVHGASEFPEQTPYLEWRNSIFSDHDGATATSRSCQSCHMVDIGSTRIARNPGGRDFNIPVRDHVRGHQFVGGNAFMLELLNTNRDALGVVATPAAMLRAIDATRGMLYGKTATLEITNVRRDDATLHFDLTIRNLTGHKFPTAYPSRRAWIQTIVRAGGETVFYSGGTDGRGRIEGIRDPFGQPHVDVVRTSADVPIYEMIAHDHTGAPTTLLTDMATRAKDNRLLPAGWQPDGPFADDTRPVGTDGDTDFTDGADTIHYAIDLPSADAPPVTITIWFRYQTVPPTWVDPMRAVNAAETERFVTMYDAADPSPEPIAVTVHIEE